MRRSLTAVALAAAFGAADQFLAARSAALGAWAIDASLLSAPWLLVGFLAGWSQPTPTRGMVLGLVCTLAALAGYWAMTLSPVEGASVTLRSVRGLVFGGGVFAGQARYLAGGIVTGPLFGWLGNRWRTRRDSISGLAVALAVCCEPLAHAASGTMGYTTSFREVWAVEVAGGFAMALYVLAAARRRTAS